MARPRKNAGQRQKSLPIPAEIPVEEQPYALPQGWKWVYLRTGYEITSSKRIHKSDWRESGIPFYRTREFVKLSKYGYVDNELFIDKALYENIKHCYGVPSKNDILISGVGTIGVPYVVNDKNEFYFKDGNIIWLKNKKVFFQNLYITCSKVYLLTTKFMKCQQGQPLILIRLSMLTKQRFPSLPLTFRNESLAT